MAINITKKLKEAERNSAIKAGCGTQYEPYVTPCGCTQSTSCDTPSCCAIKTRVKDCHIFRGVELERSFLFTNGACNADAFYVTSCVSLHIRRRGCCKVLMVEEAYKINTNGAVVFKWSAAFRQLSDGYYEADVYRGKKSCRTECFYLAPCADRLETDEIIMQEDCGSLTCLEVDQEPADAVITGCETC